ncbi:MAG: response regulator transcription factor [Ruminococcus sp.]|nr:response regulator transcription factor [Ruminococcus sp.]
MTFRIAVCDDEQIICTTLYNKLKKISEIKLVKFEIDCFNSGEELCCEMKSTNYDLLFLDIELPEMNGVAVGKYIRESLNNELIQIAYISSKQEYAMKLFEMRPINFLVKPLSDDKIAKIIDKFLLLNRVDTELFEFKSGHSFYKVPFADILYFGSNGRKIKIVTQSTEYEFYDSLDTIYKEIKNKKFLFVHKSFIVNFRYITKYQYEQIIMSNNKIIPISQSRRKAIRSIFLKTKEAELL